MSDRKSTLTKRYPLHLTIAFAFTALLLVIGLALITFNYIETRKIAILGADDLLERTSLHLQTSIAELYVPAQNLVDVLSRAVSAEETDLEDRLADLPLFAEPLLRRASTTREAAPPTTSCTSSTRTSSSWAVVKWTERATIPANASGTRPRSRQISSPHPPFISSSPPARWASLWLAVSPTAVAS